MTFNSNVPRVSIFIPMYNREHYIAATLDSLLEQTWQHFEIIIADDGSSDGSVTVAKQYAARDSRVQIFSLPHRGEVKARNDAIWRTNPGSKYLLNHDSDDISLPTKLQELVHILDTCPEIDIVGCQACYFDDTGKELGIPPIETHPDRIRATFGEVNSMINSAALIRREVFERIGFYREEFRSVDDYDFFSRALMAGCCLMNVPKILHRIRLHPNSVGSTRAQLQAELAQNIQRRYRDVMSGQSK